MTWNSKFRHHIFYIGIFVIFFLKDVSFSSFPFLNYCWWNFQTWRNFFKTAAETNCIVCGDSFLIRGYWDLYGVQQVIIHLIYRIIWFLVKLELNIFRVRFRSSRSEFLFVTDSTCAYKKVEERHFHGPSVRIRGYGTSFKSQICYILVYSADLFFVVWSTQRSCIGREVTDTSRIRKSTRVAHKGLFLSDHRS